MQMKILLELIIRSRRRHKRNHLGNNFELIAETETEKIYSNYFRYEQDGKSVENKGGENSGGGEHTIKPLPKKTFWTPPPLVIRFPPPPFTPCHFL